MRRSPPREAPLCALLTSAEKQQAGHCHEGRSSPLTTISSLKGGAPADLREALVGPQERVQVRGVVQVERRVREPDNPPPRRATATNVCAKRAAGARVQQPQLGPAKSAHAAGSTCSSTVQV